MKKLSISMMLLFVLFNVNAQQPVIVSPQWLKENMKDAKLLVVQVDFLRYDYQKEHIAGARFLWPSWLTNDSPDASYNPPDAKAATKILQQLGINKDSRIVLCHTKANVPITARMFVTLEYLGLQGRVFFLNGGLDAWKNAGYPVTAELPVVKKGNYIASINPVLVDKDYVQHSLQTKTAEVVDARLKRYYDGDPTGNPRDGHITGAKNIPYPDLIDSANNFKSQTALTNYFHSVIPDKQKEFVSYCFIGQSASVVYLAGRQLGYKVKLYDGSIQEWSRLNNLPMEKTKKQ